MLLLGLLRLSLSLFLLSNLIATIVLIGYDYHHATALSVKEHSYKSVIIKDHDLKAEVVFKGLKFPTSMAFLGPNDILVLQENNGAVRRIVNGKMLPEALVHVNVATKGGRGMLGIAVAKHDNGPTYVFLYFIESTGIKGGGSQPDAKARLYRYELTDNKLINPKLLLDLKRAGSFQNGGKILIGPDQNVYLTVGELKARDILTRNIQGGSPPDGSSGILRVTQDGDSIRGGNILGDIDPASKYYAYGIRNSFGMDFDPATGKLWDSENGDRFGDEINLVEHGFNSGYSVVQGIWVPSRSDESVAGDVAPKNPEGLVDFGGKGKYSIPEFTWYHTLGPTALKFLNSDKLGKQYRNDMFVGVFNGGSIFHFELNQKRTALSLNGSLADKVADTDTENEDITFGTGFRGITDIQVGPDGYLYILSYYFGAIFKILKNN
jgi:aldose sugar dehydrogenase